MTTRAVISFSFSSWYSSALFFAVCTSLSVSVFNFCFSEALQIATFGSCSDKTLTSSRIKGILSSVTCWRLSSSDLNFTSKSEQLVIEARGAIVVSGLRLLFLAGERVVADPSSRAFAMLLTADVADEAASFLVFSSVIFWLVSAIFLFDSSI